MTQVLVRIIPAMIGEPRTVSAGGEWSYCNGEL